MKGLISNCLKWCKFFKLVETDVRMACLSTLGFQYARALPQQKNDILARNLPDKYLTILKWISDSQGSMRLEEIKNLMGSIWGFTPTKRLADSMLNTFARTCEDIGLIKYLKGHAPRCELLKKGYDRLSLPSKPKTQSGIEEEPQKFLESIPHVTEGTRNKIIIITEFGKFETPISDIDDWELVENRLRTWKLKWRELNKSEKKGESAEET